MPLLHSVLSGPARPAFTRSRAERRLIEIIRAAKLPLPEANVPVGDQARERYEADLLWREHGLIVEFDSVEFHADARAFQSDRARDAYMLTRGYRVMRVTWEQLVDEPEVVLARIAGALAASGAAA